MVLILVFLRGSVPTGWRNGRVRARSGPLPLGENFLALHRSLNVGLGASEENDFDQGVPRRTLVLTTSQGVPCEGSFFCRCMPEADNWTKCPRGQYNRPLADPAASHQLGRTK